MVQKSFVSARPGASTSPPRSKRILYVAAALLPSIAVALVGLAAALRNADWYDGLTLPSFAPPAAGFGAAWGGFDLLLAWAFHRVLIRPDWMPDRPAAIRAFAMEIGFDLLWPLVFFGARSPAAGLLAVVLLLLATLVMGRRFGLADTPAGLCCMVCGGWVGFATLVNLSVVIRN